ncbi:hypothetical protein HDU87_005293 [Geranomyces variabilis]|uniref:Uncharacterized protein n=1 Tax=Geranomyces variabilis TaxID=109894 RepID=A0AAD5XLC1_9FUNG|nr:hypothetical protein HDU87_005293 [Geranomyces variabilis]
MYSDRRPQQHQHQHQQQQQQRYQRRDYQLQHDYDNMNYQQQQQQQHQPAAARHRHDAYGYGGNEPDVQPLVPEDYYDDRGPRDHRDMSDTRDLTLRDARTNRDLSYEEPAANIQDRYGYSDRAAPAAEDHHNRVYPSSRSERSDHSHQGPRSPAAPAEDYGYGRNDNYDHHPAKPPSEPERSPPSPATLLDEPTSQQKYAEYEEEQAAAAAPRSAQSAAPQKYAEYEIEQPDVRSAVVVPEVVEYEYVMPAQQQQARGAAAAPQAYGSSQAPYGGGQPAAYGNYAPPYGGQPGAAYGQPAPAPYGYPAPPPSMAAYGNNRPPGPPSNYAPSSYAASSYAAGAPRPGYPRSNTEKSYATSSATTKYSGPAAYAASRPLQNAANKGDMGGGGKSPLNKRDTLAGGKPRYCCGCFGSRKRCIISIMLPLVALGILLGVLIWYYFPSVPGVMISTPYIPASPAGFNPATAQQWVPGIVPTGNLATASPGAPFDLKLGLGVNVTVNSQNNMGFTVNQINVLGTLVKGMQDPTPISTDPANTLAVVSTVTDVHIDKRANTTIKLPVTIHYSATKPITQSLSDPVISALIAACGLPGVDKVPGAMIYMRFKVEIDLKLLAWLPMNPPTRDQTEAFTCPASFTDQLARVPGLQAISGATNAATGAANAAGNAAAAAAGNPAAAAAAGAAAATAAAAAGGIPSGPTLDPGSVVGG